MSNKILLVIGYLSIVHVFILLLVVYSLYTLYEKKPYVGNQTSLFFTHQQFKALPENTSQTTVEVASQDARVDVLKEFFTRYNSPLLPYAEHIVAMADKYNLDFKLIPAIAMQESTLCKKIPKNSYNCWGFGIYGGKITRFSGYEEAIETVSKTLSKEYVAKGFTDPETIMKKYTPSSNGSWADAVNLVMNRIHEAL